MTRASVIVPSRGGAQRLPRLLAALGAQTHPDVEIVVVVDGDIDGSAEVLAHLPITARRIVFPENRGRSAALNAGFAAATGDVLIRCDDDLEPAPEWVAAHIAAHAGEPVGIIGLYRNVYPDGAYARAYGRKADLLFAQEAYATPPGRTWRYWAGNASVTRETFALVGPYSSHYRSYGWEDVDWGYRLQAAGIPVHMLPGAESVHHSPSVSAAVRSKRAYLSGSARRTFERLHGVDAAGPVHRPGGLWGGAVRALAWRADEARVQRVASLVDRTIAVAPPKVGEKLVALAVESAAIAGYDRNEPSRSTV